MKITNRTNLPAPLVAALRDDAYSRGEADISVTALIAPARKVALEELHAAELEEDAADKAAILIGKAVHAYIAAKATGELSDKRRLMMAVNGWVVSGQTDHADDSVFTVEGGRLLDYKTVTINVFLPGKIRDDRMYDFECQLNSYAELVRSNGYTAPTGLTAALIFKDWSDTQADFNANYPPHSITEVDVPLWPREQAQAYVLERVRAHQAARVELPECSDDERWLRDAKWAVRKGGTKRALKLHDTEADARAHVAELLAKDARVPYTVEYRPGTPVRCLYYCPVGAMGLCSQYEAWKVEGGEAANV